MKYEFELDKDDFLIHQLFFASKSKNIQEQRVKSYLIVAITFIACTIFSYIKNSSASHFILLITLLIIFLYPILEKWRQKIHYKKYVDEVLKKRFNKKVQINITDINIEEFENFGYSVISLETIEEIIEIKNYIYLKVNNGTAIILPKNKIQNVKNLYLDLYFIREKLGIKYSKDLKWSW